MLAVTQFYVHIVMIILKNMLRYVPRCAIIDNCLQKDFYCFVIEKETI